MSASYPPSANKSCRIWTERDDELPWFMADMLATAIRSEVLEAAIPPEEDAVGQSSSMAACLNSPPAQGDMHSHGYAQSDIAKGNRPVGRLARIATLVFDRREHGDDRIRPFRD